MSNSARWGKIAVLAALAVGLFVAYRFLPVEETLRSVLEWVRGLGVWGPLVVGALYVPATVLLVPGSVITLGAGALFGVVVGTIAVSLGSTAGACAAFWVGRTLARDWVAAKVAGNPRFKAIDRAVGRQGFKIVLLTRLSPVFPFTLLNYAFGVTEVRFTHYALASWIGMLPGTVMYVYLGSALKTLAATSDRPRTPAEQVFFWAGLAVAVGVAVLVTRIARKALKDAAPGGTT